MSRYGEVIFGNRIEVAMKVEYTFGYDGKEGSFIACPVTLHPKG